MKNRSTAQVESSLNLFAAAEMRLQIFLSPPLVNLNRWKESEAHFSRSPAFEFPIWDEKNTEKKKHKINCEKFSLPGFFSEATLKFFLQIDQHKFVAWQTGVLNISCKKVKKRSFWKFSNCSPIYATKTFRWSSTPHYKAIRIHKKILKEHFSPSQIKVYCTGKKKKSLNHGGTGQRRNMGQMSVRAHWDPLGNHHSSQNFFMRSLFVLSVHFSRICLRAFIVKN